MDSMVDFLTGLLKLGVAVFAPTPAGDGYNRGANWQTFTADGNTERLSHYRPGTDALCALCGPQIAVVDVDPRNGADPGNVLALLYDLGVKVFAEVDTPGGGKHYYVAGHPDLRSAHFRPDHPQWPGLDIQSFGTNVFLPGTARHDKGYAGRGYEIVWADLEALADGGDPDGGEALADWVSGQHAPRDERPDSPVYDGHFPTDREHAYLEAALSAECAEVACTTTGGRNVRLNAAAYRLGQLAAGAGLDEARAESELAVAAAKCGLDPAEAAATIRSGLRGGRKHPRAVPGDDEPAAIELPPPTEFWALRPELAAIRQWAHARICSPWAVLGAVLLRVACCIPPFVTLPAVIGGRGSLNLIVALVGPPGSGKDAALDVAEQCFPGRTTLDPIFHATLGTGEGIAHVYRHREKGTKDNPRGDVIEDRNAALFTCSEVDTARGNILRTGSTLLGKLRDAYTGNDLGAANATADRALTLPKHSYRFALAMCVQPLHAGWILDDVGGGLPQRLLWMPSVDPSIGEDIPPTPEPLATITSARFAGSRREITIPTEVQGFLRQQQILRQRGSGDALDGHALFTQEKVAVLLAVLNGRDSMTLADWELAGQVMAVSNRTRTAVQMTLRKSAEDVADFQARRTGISRDIEEEAAGERAARRIAVRLEAKLAAGGGEMARRELSKTLNSTDRKLFAEALDLLVSLGRARVEENIIKSGCG